MRVILEVAPRLRTRWWGNMTSGRIERTITRQHFDPLVQKKGLRWRTSHFRPFINFLRGKVFFLSSSLRVKQTHTYRGYIVLNLYLKTSLNSPCPSPPSSLTTKIRYVPVKNFRGCWRLTDLNGQNVLPLLVVIVPNREVLLISESILKLSKGNLDKVPEKRFPSR